MFRSLICWRMKETVSREFGAYSLDGGMKLNMKSGVMFQSGVH